MTIDNEPSPTISPIIRGAVCRPVQVDREMKMYLVQENELKIISTFNAQVTLWSSIGVASLTYLFACLWDMCTSDAGGKVGVGICIIAVVVSIVAFGAALWYRRNRNMLLSDIQKATNVKGTAA